MTCVAPHDADFTVSFLFSRRSLYPFFGLLHLGRRLDIVAEGGTFE